MGYIIVSLFVSFSVSLHQLFTLFYYKLQNHLQKKRKEEEEKKVVLIVFSISNFQCVFNYHLTKHDKNNNDI